MITGKRLFITGGAGFIGTHIISRLIEHNEIVLFDNLRRNALQYFGLADHPHLKSVTGDILDAKALTGAMTGCDLVFHLAAVAGVSSYYKTPLKTMEVNALGTYNVLTAAKEAGAGLFVNFSTSEVYGPEAECVSEEDLTKQGSVTDRRWTYSVSKLAAEHLCFAFSAEEGLPVISFRPFNVYGPGQVGEGAVQIFCRNCLQNKELEITGDGSQVRAWCYIDDMVDAVLLGVENKKALNNTFNIGNPQAACTIKELALQVIELSASGSRITRVPHPGTDVSVRIPDISKAQTLLGFLPAVSLREGIQRSLQWYVQTLRAL
ncbi:MAG: NAD-dependent epimerase/dehydratase family protein [Candidatus Omnitrophica bacterium]|nr:NAD-dependent epimerase/dehydratase family protein [Candidatus Omnitrophota bacterium]